MKKIFILFSVLLSLSLSAQVTFNAPISYTTGVPTGAPSASGSRIRVDLLTNKIYQWQPTALTWKLLPYGIAEISGCAAPAYTPTVFDGPFAINKCTPTPELYYYFSGSWKLVGGPGGGGSYTAGYGIDIALGVIKADTSELVTPYDLSQVDQSATNEIQTISYSSPTVSLSSGGSVSLSDLNETVSAGYGVDVTQSGQDFQVKIDTSQVATPYDISQATQTVSAGTGISVNQVGQDYTVTNTGDLSATNELNTTLTVTGGNLRVTDAGGNLDVPVTDIAPVQAVAAGTGISISGTTTRTITNTAPDQTVALTEGGIVDITGTYPSFTISATEVDGSTTNELQTLSVATNTATLSNGGGSVTIAGDGINTVGTAGTTITITGTEVDGSITNELQTVSTGTNTLTLSDGGGTVTVDTDPTNDLTTSSTAGGDLSGTFSNLQIVADAVGTTEIADDAVTSAKIATDAVGQTEIAANAVGSSELQNTTVTAGTYTNATVTFDADGRATSASSGNDGFNDVFQVSGSNLEITDGGGTLTVPVATIAPDQSTTNELQTLSFTSPNLSISSGNSVDLTGVPGTVSTNSTLTGTGSSGSPLGIAQQGATTGQVIKWSGTAWLPEDESEIGTGTDPIWGADSRVISTPLNTVKVYMGEDPDGSITGYSDPFGVFAVEVAGSADDDYSKMRFAMQEGNISTSLFNPTTGTLVGSTILTPLSINQSAPAYINTAAGTGDVIMGAAIPSNQRATVSSRLRLQLSYTPTGTADTNGFVGDVVWDDDYWYVKTSAGWKRAALSTF